MGITYRQYENGRLLLTYLLTYRYKRIAVRRWAEISKSASLSGPADWAHPPPRMIAYLTEHCDDKSSTPAKDEKISFYYIFNQ